MENNRIEKIIFFLFCLVVLVTIGQKIILRIERSTEKAPSVSVTIPEGFNNDQIAGAILIKLKNFNQAQFLTETKNLEGYLFPDTYFFLTTAGSTDVVKTMTDNFNKRIASVLPEISASGKTEKDIIIMASIIEKEAKGDTDREVISGILWKRLSISMALEVDSAPETYKTRGLPASPISNPGLASIEAAIHPTISPYLYYLHDKSGDIHYAATFAEHQANEKKYLNKKI